MKGIFLLEYNYKKRNRYSTTWFRFLKYLLRYPYYLLQLSINLLQVKICEKKLSILEKKLINYKAIKIVFVMHHPSKCPSRPLIDRMIKDSRFDVSIVLCDLSHKDYFNDDNFCCPVYFLKCSRRGVTNEGKQLELNQIADVCVLDNIYDSRGFFLVTNLVRNNVLPVLVNYTYFRCYYETNFIIKHWRSNCYWKIFF